MENKKTHKNLDKILIIFIILFSILGTTYKALAGTNDHELWKKGVDEYLQKIAPWMGGKQNEGIISDVGGKTKDEAERADTGIEEVGVTGSNGDLNTGEGGSWNGDSLFQSDFVFSSERTNR